MEVNELKAELARNGLELKDLAKALDISKAALYRKTKGISEFKLSEISKIRDFLHLNPKRINEIFFNEKVS